MDLRGGDTAAGVDGGDVERVMARVVYFSVDVEASGPVPALYNLVSIGAVPIGRHEGTWHPEDGRFYVELRPIAPGFDPEAMAVHGIPRERLEKDGIPADEAMRRLALFVRERLGGSGDRAVFDWAYISYYFEIHRLPNPFGYKALDIKSFAMGRLGIEWLDTSKEVLRTLLPSVPVQDAARAHRADYDAFYQAQIFCALLNLPRRA